MLVFFAADKVDFEEYKKIAIGYLIYCSIQQLMIR